jgi:hypothetical protein
MAMRRVKFSDLQVGMVIASDVTGFNGELLLSKGTELTEKTIRTLQNRQVASVSIEGEKEDVLAKLPPGEVTEFRESLGKNFSEESLKNPVTLEFINIFIERHFKKKYPELFRPKIEVVEEEPKKEVEVKKDEAKEVKQEEDKKG